MTQPDPALALVQRYAEAKSRQDVDAALALCDPAFTIETIPFGTASRDAEDTASQLRLFFSVFPDYAVDTEGLARNGGSIAWWGSISVTFGGDLFGLRPTGRRASLPAFSVFDLRTDRLLRERFFFDLHMLCEGIGVRTEDLATALGRIGSAAAA